MDKIFERWKKRNQKDLSFHEFIDADGNVTLYHYTDEFPGNADVILLDPKVAQARRGSYSDFDNFDKRVPRLWFYLRKGDREEMFEDSDCYSTDVPADMIYDLHGKKGEETIPKIAKSREYSGAYFIHNKIPMVNWFETLKLKHDE